MKLNLFNLIILDESGSMSSIEKAALGGLNETLQSVCTAQKTYKGTQQQYVTLVSFHSGRTKYILENAPASAIRMLTDKDYQPACCTPLYDAMGNSLSRLRHQLDAKATNKVLVTVISDGYENASTEYSGKMIKHLVEELKAEGWTFTYIGANQDVDAVAESLSIKNKMCYEATPEGTRHMMKIERSSREKFYMKCDINPLYACEGDFFSDGDPDEKPVPPQPAKKSLFARFKK